MSKIDTSTSELALMNRVPSSIGRVIYSFKQPINHGFETNFAFKISNSSKSCNALLNEASPNPDETLSISASTLKVCRTEHGDGFAFIISGESMSTLIQNGTTARFASSSSATGSGLGYDGLFRTLALEFDLRLNSDRGDPSSQHISIHAAAGSSDQPTSGRHLLMWVKGHSDTVTNILLASSSANHRLSLGHTSSFGAITDSRWHRVRVTYSAVESVSRSTLLEEELQSLRTTEYGSLLADANQARAGFFVKV